MTHSGDQVDRDDIDAAILEFVESHELTPDDQLKQLVEEVGELAEAFNRENSADVIGECADIRFVARSIELMLGNSDPEGSLQKVTAENAAKNGEKDGNKVTKA